MHEHIRRIEKANNEAAQLLQIVNAKIAGANRLLQDAGACITVWTVELSGNEELLGFAKVNGEWQLALAHIGTAAKRPLLGASRLERTEAVAFIDRVVEHLANETVDHLGQMHCLLEGVKDAN